MDKVFMDLVPIADIKIGDRFRKEFAGIDELAASIEAIGLLQPVGITKGRDLVFGHRRLLALQKLGRDRVPVKYVDADNALLSEHDENVLRQDFTISEKVAIAEALQPRFAAAAAKNKNQHTKSAGGKVTPAKTRDAVAEKVGLSAPTLKKARAVVAAARINPIKYAPIVEEMDKSGNVSAAFRSITSEPSDRGANTKLPKEILDNMAELEAALIALKPLQNQHEREATATVIEALAGKPISLMQAMAVASRLKASDRWKYMQQIEYFTKNNIFSKRKVA